MKRFENLQRLQSLTAAAAAGSQQDERKKMMMQVLLSARDYTTIKALQQPITIEELQRAEQHEARDASSGTAFRVGHLFCGTLSFSLHILHHVPLPAAARTSHHWSRDEDASALVAAIQSWPAEWYLTYPSDLSVMSSKSRSASKIHLSTELTYLPIAVNVIVSPSWSKMPPWMPPPFLGGHPHYLTAF